MGSLDNKLYILHGWTTNVTKWDPFLDELKKRGVDPILLKIPGLTAPLETPWTIDDYVTWLATQLPDDKHVSVLGHSNGGRIALAFALKFPERLDQIFLIDSAGIYHNDFVTKSKRTVFKLASIIGKKITSSNNARNLLYRAASETDYMNATPVMRQTMSNLIKVNLTPHLSKIQTPVTIIWGKNDITTPFTDGQVFKNELPNSSLYTIDYASHSPQFTHVQEVADIIKNEFK